MTVQALQTTGDNELEQIAESVSDLAKRLERFENRYKSEKVHINETVGMERLLIGKVEEQEKVIRSLQAKVKTRLVEMDVAAMEQRVFDRVLANILGRFK